MYPRSFRPQLEELGSRVLPSANPVISITDVAIAEGHSGQKAFVFTVTLSKASHRPVRVDFATADGTATVADNDYVATSGRLKFEAGQTTKTITVLVNGDVKEEPDETFFVNLSRPENAVIADAQGFGTILNDDAPPPPGVPVDNAGQPQPVDCPDCYLYEGWWRPVQPPQDPDFVF